MAWAVTEDIHNPPHWPLAKDKARHQGDGVAVVVAETRAAAVDAAEAVEVDYEELSVVVDKVFAEAPVVVKERYVIQRQIPTAIEPRSVLAQPSTAQGSFTLWSSTQ